MAENETNQDSRDKLQPTIRDSPLPSKAPISEDGDPQETLEVIIAELNKHLAQESEMLQKNLEEDSVLTGCPLPTP